MVNRLSRRTLSLAFLFASLIYIVSGYLLSEAFFFKRLVYQNNITSPEEAFTFVVRNTGIPDLRSPPPLEYSPRLMLTKQKNLFCDQSAVVMAVIVRELGYDTRLVDWVGDDGISHHTILEVKQGGEWKAYDTLNRRQGETYEQIKRELSYNGRPVYRKYVGSRWINRNNYYFQHLSLWLRRAKDG